MQRPNKIWFRQDIGRWMVTIAGKKVRLAQGRNNKEAAQRKFHELMIVRHESPDIESPRRSQLHECSVRVRM